MTTLSFLELFSPGVAALTTFVLLGVLMRRRNVPLDKPNERSLHTTPVPRVGGLAILPGIAAAWFCIPGAVFWVVWIPAVFLFALSFLDDARSLRVSIRLFVHLLSASIVAYALVLASAGWLAAVCVALGITWMTNLYNFMDGSDGLAGGMALIGFAAYAVGAFVGGAPLLGQACLAIVAAAAVFLRYNFHPARVFLGDAGSIPLGFLAAALGAQGWVEGLWPAWFPVLVFSPFVVDASVTLARRALRGEKLWRAHREHFYQRLVRMGWGHRRTALAAYVLMAASGTSALVGLNLPLLAQGLVLGTAALLYLVLMRSIDQAWSQSGDLSK